MNGLDKRCKSIFKTYIGLPNEVYILFIGKMINCIGAFIHPLLTLILTQKIGLSIKEAGVFVTISAIAQAPCILIGGKLVDYIGRKKVIVIFQTIASSIFLVCGIINPSKVLAILIIFASCFSSIANPAYDSIVGDITNEKNRKASFSLIYMGLNLGFAIGPVLGGMLFQNHFNLIFIGDAATTLLSVTLIGLFVRETNPKFIETNEKYENKSLEAEEDGSVFQVLVKRPILIYYSIIMITFNFAYAQWGFAIPIKLEELFGTLGAKYFGILGGCNGIIVIIATPILIFITRKFKIIKVISSGGLLYALAFLICSFSSKLVSFYIVIILITIGEVAVATNSGTFVTNLTPKSHRGRVNSIIPLIYGIGNALGATIMGNLIEYMGINEAFLVVSVVAGIGGIAMYCLNYVDINYDFEKKKDRALAN